MDFSGHTPSLEMPVQVPPAGTSQKLCPAFGPQQRGVFFAVAATLTAGTGERPVKSGMGSGVASTERSGGAGW